MNLVEFKRPEESCASFAERIDWSKFRAGIFLGMKHDGKPELVGNASEQELIWLGHQFQCFLLQANAPTWQKNELPPEPPKA
jgi:hypothetical protein